MRYEYSLPDGVGIADVAEALCGRFRFRDLGGQRWEVCYFDTFDWRLFMRGYVLEQHRNGSSRHLHWRCLGAEAPDRFLPNARMPDFAHELPAGAFRRRLEAVTEPRALLPQAIVHTHGHLWQLEDDAGKTLARAVVECGRLARSNGDGAAPALARRLRLEPLRGYEGRCEPVRAAIEGLGLRPAREDAFVEALRSGGRQPAAYRVRPRVSLESEQRTDEAVRTLLAALLAVMECNVPGVRARTDPEFLHDFRTAVRRMRALLSELAGVLPKRLLERFRRDLKWLGEATGPARDLDVLWLAFDDYAAVVSAQGTPAGALDPCRRFIRRELESAYEELDRRLHSARFTRFVAGLRDFLASPVPRRTPLAHAMSPVREFADRRLARRFKRLRRAARATGQAGHGADGAEHLHECRILAKRARYLLDAFATLYRKREVKSLRTRLKRLQDALGEHHDRHVHAQALLDLAERMQLQEALDAQAAQALGVLCERLRAEQHALGEAATALLQKFGGGDVRRACRRAFEST